MDSLNANIFLVLSNCQIWSLQNLVGSQIYKKKNNDINHFQALANKDGVRDYNQQIKQQIDTWIIKNTFLQICSGNHKSLSIFRRLSCSGSNLGGT